LTPLEGSAETPRRDGRTPQVLFCHILRRISGPRRDEHIWQTKLPRSAHELLPPQRPPAPPPGHGSAPVPHSPLETSTARCPGSEPAGTRFHRRAPGSKPQRPARMRTICEGATVGQTEAMSYRADLSSQQSARCDLPLPRPQLGSGE
jgi:hypothetical protein